VILTCELIANSGCTRLARFAATNGQVSDLAATIAGPINGGDHRRERSTEKPPVSHHQRTRVTSTRAPTVWDVAHCVPTRKRSHGYPSSCAHGYWGTVEGPDACPPDTRSVPRSPIRRLSPSRERPTCRWHSNGRPSGPPSLLTCDRWSPAPPSGSLRSGRSPANTLQNSMDDRFLIDSSLSCAASRPDGRLATVRPRGCSTIDAPTPTLGRGGVAMERRQYQHCNRSPRPMRSPPNGGPCDETRSARPLDTQPLRGGCSSCG